MFLTVTSTLGPRHERDRPFRRIKIPTEVLNLIFDSLPRSDWRSIRLVCRGFYENSTELPLFKSLWFSPHREDIDVFLAVCRHPWLGKHVTTIHYDLIRFAAFTPMELYLLWSRTERHRQYLLRMTMEEQQASMLRHQGTRLWLQHLNDQEAGTVQGHQSVEECLSIGLQRLSKVFKIIVEDNFDNPHLSEFYSPLHRLWMKEDNLPPCGYPDEKKHTPKIISTKEMRNLLKGIYMSGARIEDMEFRNDGIKVPISAFEVVEFEQAAFTFNRLRRLVIAIQISSLDEITASPFVTLIQGAKALNSLALSTPSHRSSLVSPQPDAQIDYLKVIFADATLPCLGTLRLNGFSAETETLLEILHRHASTLQDLYLGEIQIFESELHWGRVFKLIMREIKINRIKLQNLRGEQDGFVNLKELIDRCEQEETWS